MRPSGQQLDPARRLSGAVIVVTGAAGGIGSATVRRLAREGAALVAVDLREDAVRRLAEDVRAEAGAEAIGLGADIAEPDDWDRVVRTTLATFGRLDGLHNNAALVSDAVMAGDGPVGEADLALWADTLRVNVLGTMLGCRAVVPAMLERGGGAIVNTSSIAALLGFERLAAYSASKAAIVALTRSVATAYGKQGIRCNCIAPGTVLTAPTRFLLDDDGQRILEEAHLTPYLGTPEHVAAAVAFLLSDDAAFMTGALVHVDGGFTAHEPAFGRSR